MTDDVTTDLAPADLSPTAPARDDALVLPASLDLTAAEPLQRALLDRIARDGVLALDGSGVERVSTACLQVLLAAKQSFPLRFVATSAALNNAVRDLGLDGALGMEIA